MLLEALGSEGVFLRAPAWGSYDQRQSCTHGANGPSESYKPVEINLIQGVPVRELGCCEGISVQLP